MSDEAAEVRARRDRITERKAHQVRAEKGFCLLADIGWRAHPDYRGEQSLNVIANAAFVGLDHPGRAYLALAVYYRHVGLIDDELSPQLRELASPRMIDRARVLGCAMRVAYLASAGMPGVLPHVRMTVDHGRLVLEARRRVQAARRRALVQPATSAGPPHRTAARDGDGVIA